MEIRRKPLIILGAALGLLVMGIIVSYPKLSGSVSKPDVRTSATLWMNPLAMVIPGDNPLWFELVDEGPSVISSPGEASLGSFLPWPYSIHIQDMMIQENRLILAVNRQGFLAIIPWDDYRLGMYPVFDKAHFARYSIASLFMFDQIPSVLLYRDDFFSDHGSLPLPETPVKGLVKGSIQPMDGEVPAFRNFPSSKGWDLEALTRGKNGDWYFSAVQKSSAMHEKLYYKTGALDKSPSSISMGDYWIALEPESLGKADPLLRGTAEKALSRKSGISSYLIEAISPDDEYKTFYSSGNGVGESSIVSLFAFANNNTALVVFTQGAGAVGKKNEDETIETNLFTLPELPEDFFYTGIALVDNTIIASWEEQHSYGVGAAGFVLVRSPFN